MRAVPGRRRGKPCATDVEPLILIPLRRGTGVRRAWVCRLQPNAPRKEAVDMHRVPVTWVLGALLAMAAVAPVKAHEGGQPSHRMVTVVGEGEASVPPDLAIVTLAVETEGPTAAEA